MKLKLSSNMNECKPLMRAQRAARARRRCRVCCGAGQGLTLVHFSAERKRVLWDRKCAEGLFRGCLGVVMG